MTYSDQLHIEIATECDEVNARGEKLHPTWIAHKICSNHNEGLVCGSEHSDFWEWSAHRTVRSEVGTYLRCAYGAGSDEAVQLSLPGFEHIQTHYIVARDETEIAVSVYEITDDEIKKIMRIMRRGIRTQSAHCDELARFMALRNSGKWLQKKA